MILAEKISDEIYVDCEKNKPTKDSFFNSLTVYQKKHIRAMLLNRLKEVTFQNIYNEIAATHANTFDVSKYVNDVTFNCAYGQQQIKYVDFNLNTKRFVNQKNEQQVLLVKDIHKNEVVPNSVFQSTQDNLIPGKLSFTFDVPSQFSFPEMEQPSTGYHLFTKGNGKFAYKLYEGNKEILCKNGSHNQNWNNQGDIKILNGKTYTIEFIQTDDSFSFDSFMVISKYYPISESNPDKFPIRLYHPIYGTLGHGVQNKIQIARFKFDHGISLEMEVADNEQLYFFSSPIIRLNEDSNLKNIDIVGFDLILNGQKLIYDHAFNINEIRPKDAIISYGQAIVSKDKGIDEDLLSISFKKLELTETPGELPHYESDSKQNDLTCSAPETFEREVWPLLTKQELILPKEYQSWVSNKNYPGIIKADGTFNIVDTPSIYTCKTCHNDSHPYFPIPNNPKDGCDVTLSRTNLENPEKSYALRGLLGQFNHIPLYTKFNPFDSHNNYWMTTLTDGTTKVPVYRQNGKIASWDEIINYSEEELDLMENNLIKLNLIKPKSITFKYDLITGLPEKDEQNQIKEFYYNADSPFYAPETWLRNNEGNMTTDHSKVIKIYLEKYFHWIDEEKKILTK